MTGALQATGRAERLFVFCLLGGLSVLAWFALWHWGHSPYLHYVHHAHRHPPPGEGALFAAAIFIGGWTLMTVAMMLPTSMPLLAVFSRVSAGRSDRALLLGLVVAGYLATWSAVGLLAYALAVAVRTASERVP
jgi:predicted metal-binding membrane protein